MIGAVDIGGTKIAVGLVREDGGLAAQAQFPTEPGRGYADCLERIRRALGDLIARSGAAPESAVPQGIGIGITGRFDPDGTLHHNDFLPGWGGHNLARDLGQLLGAAAALENDADAAALGEFTWGAGRGSRRFIYITISTGIGGGMVFDGQLYRGAGGCHPEIGHHVIDPEGPPCFCGASGCWEQMASGTAMAAWARGHGGAAGWDARQICVLAEAGDPVALEAVQREGYYLGLGLANLITLFAPDCIALGGGVMQQWPLFAAKAEQIIRRNCGLVPWQKTRLALASSGQAGLVGAAAVWLHAAPDWARFTLRTESSEAS